MMRSPASRSKASIAIEMTPDPLFEMRIRRLIVISAVALGLVCLLAFTRTNTEGIWLVLLVGGWISMPILLTGSLKRPVLRYLLTAPAAMVSAGLLGVALGFEGSAVAHLGWWIMTAGGSAGGTLGAWFWYRWVPVPRSLDRPFSTGRWTLITIHAGLVVAGGGLVLFGTVL